MTFCLFRQQNLNDIGVPRVADESILRREILCAIGSHEACGVPKLISIGVTGGCQHGGIDVNGQLIAACGQGHFVGRHIGDGLRATEAERLVAGRSWQSYRGVFVLAIRSILDFTTILNNGTIAALALFNQRPTLVSIVGTCQCVPVVDNLDPSTGVGLHGRAALEGSVTYVLRRDVGLGVGAQSQQESCCKK